MMSYNLKQHPNSPMSLRTPLRRMPDEPEPTINSEYQSQQNPKQVKRGQKYTKDSKCKYCGEPVRHNKTIDGVKYYASDCRKCSGYLHYYGLTTVEVGWMYFLQEGICANPGCTQKAGCIDHCHTTNKVRNVLCHQCNTSLGSLNEDPQRIAGLIQYIAAHSEVS